MNSGTIANNQIKLLLSSPLQLYQNLMEFWNITPVSIIYFIASGISIFVCASAWNMYPVRGARVFSYMMIFVSLWVITYLLGVFSNNFDWKILMIKLEYTSMAGAIYLWVVFVAIYTQYKIWLKPLTLIIMAIIPIITIFNVLQAPNGEFIRESFELVEISGVVVFQKNYAIGFYLWAAYAYLMLLLGIVF